MSGIYSGDVCLDTDAGGSCIVESIDYENQTASVIDYEDGDRYTADLDDLRPV